MLPAYQKYLDKANKNKGENKKFLEKLKKQKPTGLDSLVQELNDLAFEDIDCLQCANCCKTTGPLLLNKDIDRLAKNQKLRPAVFTEQFLKIDEDSDYVFKSMPCTFLGEDNYCNVYQDRPNACREFPHTHQRDQLQKLKITYQNSLICPAVAVVVEELKQKLT
ncbi:MAG: YkgJ family cysteine cluster protein [Bacteroidia bacterium]|nr:YkgJ family cysteine cluster protein [Bacteroidia bacterium]MCF8425335.1 YkgJ family cysteine cluster protein [Bacteroidia bacterium]MCF8447196.1 YkgJ family cysteine cluster protein [Bacteroidia bacterium]